jgi:short subunit dehydrogenase-like uncharacterized protein
VAAIGKAHACLRTQTSYVDIMGEIEVFEAIWSREKAIRADVSGAEWFDDERSAP